MVKVIEHQGLLKPRIAYCIILLVSCSNGNSINASKLKYELDLGYEQTFYSVNDSIPGNSYSTSYCPRISVNLGGYFYYSVGVDWLQYFNSKKYFTREIYSPNGVDTVSIGEFSKPGLMIELGPGIPIRFGLPNGNYLYVIPELLLGIGIGWDFELKGCQDCFHKDPRIFDGLNFKYGSKFIYGKNRHGISLSINYENPFFLFDEFNGVSIGPLPIHTYGIAISIGYSILFEKD